MTEESASQLHVTIGSTLTVRMSFALLSQYLPQSQSAASTTLDIPFRVVGIMRPPAVNDSFWHGTTFLSSIRGLLPGSIYTGLTSSEGYLHYFSRLFARSDISKYTFELSCTLTWTYPFAATHIAIYDLNALEQDIHTVQADTSNDLYLNNPPLVEQTTTYLPTDILQRFEARVPVANVPITSLFVMIVGLVLLFVGLMTTLLIERQSGTIAVLRSRGASVGQLFGAFVTQGIGISVIALLIGPIIAIVAVHLMTHFTLVPTEQGALNILAHDFFSVLVRIGGYAGVTVIVAIATVVIATRRGIARTMLHMRRETARAELRPRWQRFNLDAIALVVAATGLALSFSIENSGVMSIQLRLLLLAPLTLLCGVALVIAGVLLCLRLLPLLLRLGATFTSLRRGAAPMLALAQISRAPNAVIRLVLMLALIVTFTIFSSLLLASQAQRIADIAAYQAGADFSGTLQQTNFTSSDLNHLTAEYRHVHGVLAASVGDITMAEASFGSLINIPIQINAVDAGTFGQAADWTPQDSSTPLPAFMAPLVTQRSTAIAHGTIPAIVDAALWQSLNLTPGAHFILYFNGNGITNGTVNFVAKAEVNHIPTINDSTESTGDSNTADGIVAGGMLVDYQTFAHVFINDFSSIGVAVPINSVWLRTLNDAASLRSVRTTLSYGQGCCLQLSTLYDRRAMITNLQSDPFYRDTVGLLVIGITALLLLAVMGSFIASWLSVRNRLTNFVVLRALGATAKQIAGMLVWEQGMSYSTGIVLGIICGLLFSLLALPFIIYTNVAASGQGSTISTGQFYLMQNVPAIQIVVPVWLTLLLILLITFFALVVVVLARLVIKPSLEQMLRLNED